MQDTPSVHVQHGQQQRDRAVPDARRRLRRPEHEAAREPPAEQESHAVRRGRAGRGAGVTQPVQVHHAAQEDEAAGRVAGRGPGGAARRRFRPRQPRVVGHAADGGRRGRRGRGIAEDHGAAAADHRGHGPAARPRDVQAAVRGKGPGRGPGGRRRRRRDVPRVRQPAWRRRRRRRPALRHAARRGRRVAAVHRARGRVGRGHRAVQQGVGQPGRRRGRRPRREEDIAALRLRRRLQEGGNRRRGQRVRGFRRGLLELAGARQRTGRQRLQGHKR